MFYHVYIAEDRRSIYKRTSVEGYLKDIYVSLYLIHNKVNDKLRKQGLNDEPNPDFKKVCEFYYHYYREINANCVNMLGIGIFFIQLCLIILKKRRDNKVYKLYNIF